MIHLLYTYIYKPLHHSNFPAVPASYMGGGSCSAPPVPTQPKSGPRSWIAAPTRRPLPELLAHGFKLAQL